MEYVTYYRVSTQRQNLGLDAQKNACDAFLAATPNAIEIATFSEKESGKDNDRPELAKAVKICKERNAVLLVAKLDRLTRDVAFGMTLKGAGVKIRALNCPEFGDDCSLMLAIMLGLAQQERELISKRTKDALQALKDKGVKLGHSESFTNEGRTKGAKAHSQNAKANKANVQAYALAKALRTAGKKDSEITRELNEAGYTTPRGKQYTQTAVSNLFRLMEY